MDLCFCAACFAVCHRRFGLFISKLEFKFYFKMYQGGEDMSKKKTALIVISAVFGLIVICCWFAYFIFGIKKVSYDTGEWNNLEKNVYLPSVC